MLYAYQRCSTNEQAISGLGLEAQREAIDGAATRLGGTVCRYYIDAGQSGGDGLDKRDQLAEALAGMKKGDTLIVAKRDRLSRDTMLASWLEKEAKKGGWRILSAAGEGTENDDPTSVLMRRIVDAFAEYERLLIGFRTKMALKAKRARGEKTGGHTPYGFVEIDGKLVENHHEQAIIICIKTDRAIGHTYAAIAENLNDICSPTRTGALWSSKTVRDIALR